MFGFSLQPASLSWGLWGGGEAANPLPLPLPLPSWALSLSRKVFLRKGRRGSWGGGFLSLSPLKMEEVA